jgi:mRNA-degrading endonuclease RelE of RelBE toxin-antitoxin system
MASRKLRTLQIHPEAREDVRRLTKLDRRLAVVAATALRNISNGSTVGVPLEKMAKFGDLSDCRKVYFGYGSPPTHRIMYRELDENTIEIIDVVAIESREDAYVYLLAAERLRRLPEETQQEFKSVHQRIIAKRALKKKE